MKEIEVRTASSVTITNRDRVIDPDGGITKGQLADHYAAMAPIMLPWAGSRYIEGAVNGILIAGLYLPNGNPRPGRKFEYKLAWFERLIEHEAHLLASGAPVVIAGDFNVLPTERDVYKPERWLDDALFAPDVRDAFFKLTAQGWTDALRAVHPDETIYTFWDYFRNAYQRDAGLRIDHLLLSPDLAIRLVDAQVDRHVRGWDKTSDHAPTWIALSDAKHARKAKKG